MINLLQTLAEAKSKLAIAEIDSQKHPKSVQKRMMVMYWLNNVQRLEAIIS